MRDRFGPLPPPVELLLQVAELKILASERGSHRHRSEGGQADAHARDDFITLGGKFPRLTRRNAKARLKEIKKLLLAI